jgi:hypothetical protein
MTTLDERFPSKWLKASDLEDGPVATTVHEVSDETVKGMDGKSSEKTIIYFPNKLKPLILNRTNFEALADISGQPDSNDWPGTKIELYTVETSMGEGIRIREPGGKSKKNQRQQPVKKTEPPPPIEKDMDDEIPF